MQKRILIVSSCLAMALADVVLPKQDPKDKSREFDWKVKDGVLSAYGRGTVFKDDNHKVDAYALLNKNLLDKNQPTSFGGRVDYKSLNSNAGASVKALNSGPYGTSVGAEGTYNFFKDRTSSFDVGAGYQQRFGGMFGRSEPNFNAFVRGTF
uniref:Attacin 1 n=1 Tax=Microdera dzhungarica TaxID=302182 RepID=W5U353_9CUCU|nr:attacin 1 [Microdera dzhungarica]